MKPYYEQDGITIYHGDCRDVLPDIVSAGVIVADPPYTFGLRSTEQGGKSGSWGDLMNNAIFYAWFLREFKRLLSHTGGAAWVFNSWRSMPVLARASCEAPWPILSTLVWDKDWISADGQRGLRPSYELVALFGDESFALKDRSVPDIWRYGWSSFKPNGHPAEKPIELVARMIALSQPRAAPLAVLDPFMGSGTTLHAAKDAGFSAIGIEIEERYCEIAARRLDQCVLPLEPGL